MDPKRRDGEVRRRYIQTLRALTPQQRLEKAFELSQMTKDLLRAGLRRRHPHLNEEQLQQVYLERMKKCHNRNY